MIGTERLLLRAWREDDVDAHYALVSDPEFMKHMGPPLSRSQSEAVPARQNANLAAYGSCFWAVELRETGAMIGYCGIKPGPADTPVAGLPEIGWGIAPALWRRGLACEAAEACLAWAWTERDWAAVYAITWEGNAPSRGVMARIGMAHVPDADFDHPALATDDPLRRHVTHAIRRADDR